MAAANHPVAPVHLTTTHLHRDFLFNLRQQQGTAGGKAISTVYCASS
jgi:hypothetical protein